MSEDKLEGNLSIKVTPEMHQEIKAAASNEGESVTAFVVGAIKARLAPVAKTETKGKPIRALKTADDEEAPKSFENFLEYLQQNYHNAFCREDLLPVVQNFLDGKLMPSKDNLIKR